MEVARLELGMKREMAENETAIVLREKIRRARDLTKVVQNPLASRPKGLASMKLDDLKAEAAQRQLPTLARVTRATLIEQIEDHVAMLNTLSSTEDPTPNRNPNMMEEDGYVKVETPTLKRK